MASSKASGAEDPIFCKCGAPAKAAIANKGGTFQGKPFVSCHFGKACNFWAAGPDKFTQDRRALLWSSWCDPQNPVPPGADVRLLVQGGDNVVVAVRPLASTPVIESKLEALGGKRELLKFTNSITTAGQKAVAGKDRKYRDTLFFIFPFAQYDTLRCALVMDLGISISRIFFPEKTALKAVESRIALDAAPSVPIESGGPWRNLHPYQRDGIAAGIKRNGRILIADEMGLGKTVQALGIANHYRGDGRLLVICPASLMFNWQRELMTWWRLAPERITTAKGKRTVIDSAIAAVIVSYTSVEAVKEHEFATVIVDESHSIKNDTAQRTREAIAACDRAQHVVLLTGTPTLAKPIELYTQLRALLGPSTASLPSKSLFQVRYCNAFRHSVQRGSNAMVLDDSGNNRLEELTVLLRSVMIRRRKAEVLSQLPKKTRQLLFLDIDDKDKARYNQATKGKGAKPGAAGLEQYEATATAKIPAVVEYVKTLMREFIENDDSDEPPESAAPAAAGAPSSPVSEKRQPPKVLFFAHHKQLLYAVRDAIIAVGIEPGFDPIDHIYIDGDVPERDREQLVDHFQLSPRCRAAVLSIGTCATGLNFTAASNVVFCELDWTPGKLLQCEDRVHRMGQKVSCVIKYLVALGTLDETLWETVLKEKLDVNTALVADEALGTHEDATVFADRAEGQHVQPRNGQSVANAPPPPPMQSTLDAWMQNGSVQRKTLVDIVMRDAASSATRGGKAKQDDDDDDVLEVVASHSSVVKPPPANRDTPVFRAAPSPSSVHATVPALVPVAESKSADGCSPSSNGGLSEPPLRSALCSPSTMVVAASPVPAMPPVKTLFRPTPRTQSDAPSPAPTMPVVERSFASTQLGVDASLLDGVGEKRPRSAEMPAPAPRRTRFVPTGGSVPPTQQHTIP
jgi:hypothetical protein